MKNKNENAKEMAWAAGAERVSLSLLRIQRRISDEINRRLHLLSRKAQYVTLGVVVLLWGFALVLVYTHRPAARALNGGNIRTVEIERAAGRSSNNILEAGLSEEQLRLKVVSKYLDSLKSDPYGKVLYDSIRQLRPGMLDSLLYRE